MGNLITLCIKTQVRIIGIGNLDPNYRQIHRNQQSKVCVSCNTMQHNIDHTTTSCELCGGVLVVLPQGAIDHDPWSQIPTEADKSGRNERLKKSTPWPKFNAIELITITTAMDRLNAILNKTSKTYDRATSVNGDKNARDEDNIDTALAMAENALTCSVCLDVFDRPVTLPCCHSICFKHMSEIESYNCPICRKSFASLHQTCVISDNAKLTENVKKLAALSNHLSAFSDSTKKYK